MRAFFPLVLILVSSIAFGDSDWESRFVNEWTANCQSSFGIYQIKFRSVSGDPTEDDMKVTIQIGNGPSVAVPLRPALYFSGQLSSSSRSQCNNVSTAKLGAGNTLVLIQRDDRPSENRVSAILLNRDGSILDSVFDLGAQVNLAQFIETSGELRINLIRKWDDHHGSQTMEPSPILGWLKVSESAGKIRCSWDGEDPIP